MADPTSHSRPKSPATDPRIAIVLLSGGLDSATVLAIARRDGYSCRTLAFDYGQRHRHELPAAELVSRSLGAESHKIMAIDLRAFGGSALTADIDVPKDRPHEAMAVGVPITYVPARNLIFLSLATAYAETLKARAIYIGVNAIDYSGYPDCRPEFLRAFEQAANLGTAGYRHPGYRRAPRGEIPGQQSQPAGHESTALRIHTPLIHLTKAEIITLGISLGVDYSLTHSCYDPIADEKSAGRVLACGRCDSCILRRRVPGGGRPRPDALSQSALIRAEGRKPRVRRAG